jgi:riboflavin kinase/FMN adenylyltransferase
MRLLRLPDDPPRLRPPQVVATIGNFDGVHRGHRTLIGRVVERASSLGVESAVVTFDPHPLQVIRPDAAPALLTTAEERAELFGELGVDNVLIWRFDAALQQTGAEDFLRQLGRWVRLRRLVFGPAFALGRGREGTPEKLQQIGARMGFDLEEVTPFTGEPAAHVVSSTTIRGMVGAGEILGATRALGRYPTLTGTVVSGERVGRTLGYPTANLRLDAPLAVPADGVYAAWAEVAPFTPSARRYPAAISIGTRPTFEGRSRVVEAYLIDFAGDLYGQRLRLHFVARVRGQETFASVPELVAQMGRDVETARALLVDASARDAGAALDLAADG